MMKHRLSKFSLPQGNRQRPVSALALFSAVAISFALPIAAHAEDTILVPASGGLGAKLPDIAARLTRALIQVARENGVTPELTDASRDDVFAVAGCNSDDDPCHQAVLRTLGAERLLLIHVVPGSGTTIADVELVMASRGKKTSRLNLALTSSTTARLLEEFIAKSPPLFGGSVGTSADTTTTDSTDTTGEPTSQEPGSDSGSLENGEGRPFSGPTVPENGNQPAEAGPIDPNATDTTSPEPMELGTTPSANTADTSEDGGYDFSRVQPLSWGVTGAGAGLVLTSFVFYGLAGSKQDEVNAARANTAADIERIMDLESSGTDTQHGWQHRFLSRPRWTWGWRLLDLPRCQSPRLGDERHGGADPVG